MYSVVTLNETVAKGDLNTMKSSLGKGADYKSRDKAVMEVLRKNDMIDLWECIECGRKNLYKFSSCPRCGNEK